jgi:hypothetical protein
LSDHDFGGQDCRLKLAIRDSFFPENDGDTLVRFSGGRPSVRGAGDGYDVEVSLDIADFSSLVMGAVRFRSLYDYGLAEISDPGAVAAIDRLFRVEQKPICTTPF